MKSIAVGNAEISSHEYQLSYTSSINIVFCQYQQYQYWVSAELNRINSYGTKTKLIYRLGNMNCTKSFLTPIPQFGR